MKVFLTNLDVGSGIAYVGGVIKNWLQELPITLFEYRDQTSESATYAVLQREKPDVIVINEIYPRIISPVLYYKMTYPQTVVILFSHSQKALLSVQTNDASKHNQHTVLMDLIHRSKAVYVLGARTEKNIGREIVKFCPSDPEIFSNKTNWNKRPNLFCMISNIYPVKVCEEFLKLVKNIPTSIDVYGELLDRFISQSYKELFLEATKHNLCYRGALYQEKVGEVLNQYKYIIFPHHGHESFFMVLHQAIMCGTIPIVLNDRSGKDFDGSWIDWCDGLYFGVEKIEDFISNLIKLSTDRTDLTPVSKFISTEVMKRFDYYAFKKEFQTFLDKL
jgi:hypothetical protein